MVNSYRCERCLQYVVTRNADDGTTPFSITCRATQGCEGAMFSSFYQVMDAVLAVVPVRFEWCKLGRDELKAVAKRHRRHGVPIAATLDHAKDGGLFLRELATGKVVE